MLNIRNSEYDFTTGVILSQLAQYPGDPSRRMASSLLQQLETSLAVLHKGIG